MAAETTGVVMLGRDHGQYGAVDSVAVSTGVATAISVGSDLASPSLEFKGAAEFPNEDAVVAAEAGPLVLLAVADAHFGHESSHQLISGIARQLRDDLPTTLKQVYEILGLIGATTSSQTASESTLLIVVLDRESRHGFGLSYGDSTAALVSARSTFRQLNQHNRRYVRADAFLKPTPGDSFFFDVEPDETLLVYTDGLDECHYRSPETSMRPEHILHCLARFDHPRALVHGLAERALAGVDGHPGGQDNVVIAAAAANL